MSDRDRIDATFAALARRAALGEEMVACLRNAGDAGELWASGQALLRRYDGETTA